MTPERWQQVQKLLDAALAVPVDDRARYVSDVCAGDAELQREVESLLAQVSRVDGFLSIPAQGQLGATERERSSLIGRRLLDRFVIRARLGAGGMGDVYLADDTQLRSPVALKALRDDGEPAPDSRARLLREARAAAALRDHPNIAAIYDVVDGGSGAPPLIVMEYVEGETLSDRLTQGALPREDALRFARDVADALAAAHRRGIVHRDLKPANLRVSKQKRIKVLDFGLAHRIELVAETSTMTVERALQTVAAHRIAGTPGYMSPEQLLGKPAGPPSDIFSLGVVLFEMLTGQRPFPGADILSAGIAMMSMPTPHVTSLIPDIPAPIDALVTRMLAKDPEERPSAEAVVAILDGLSPASGAADRMPTARATSRRALAIGIGALIAVMLAAGVAYWRSLRSPKVADRPAIAVLALDNLSGDSTKDYLGIGIAESLTTSLAHLSAVSVISRTSLADVPRGADARTIARDVGASLLLQGSVQQSGDRLRVNAKLVRPDGSVTWAGEADSLVADLFTLETRLAGAVIAGLAVNVSAAERQTAVVPPTQNQQALEAYWQGLAFLDRGDPASLTRAASSLEKATALDSKFAAAFGALGETYRRQYSATNDSAWIAKATTAISRGLAIDSSRTEVRISLATLYGQTGRVADAVNELRAIVAQSPDNDDARIRLAVVLRRSGNPEEALTQYQAATTLRPQYWRNHQQLGLFYFSQQRMREAAAEFTRVIELRADDANAYLQRGAARQSLGDVAGARADYERSIALDSNAAAYANLGTLEFVAGRYDAAVRALTTAIKLRPKRAMYHRNLGDAYLKLKRDRDARSEYLTAIALTEDGLRVNPNDAEMLSYLAVYEAKAGRAQEARQHSDQAVARNGRNPDVLFRRGVVFALTGDTAAAVMALKDAMDHGYTAGQLRSEDDLSSLSNVPDYRKLIQSRP